MEINGKLIQKWFRDILKESESNLEVARLEYLVPASVSCGISLNAAETHRELNWKCLFLWWSKTLIKTHSTLLWCLSFDISVHPSMSECFVLSQAGDFYWPMMCGWLYWPIYLFPLMFDFHSKVIHLAHVRLIHLTLDKTDVFHHKNSKRWTLKLIW